MTNTMFSFDSSKAPMGNIAISESIMYLTEQLGKTDDKNTAECLCTAIRALEFVEEMRYVCSSK